MHWIILFMKTVWKIISFLNLSVTTDVNFLTPFLLMFPYIFFLLASIFQSCDGALLRKQLTTFSSSIFLQKNSIIWMQTTEKQWNTLGHWQKMGWWFFKKCRKREQLAKIPLVWIQAYSTAFFLISTGSKITATTV